MKIKCDSLLEIEVPFKQRIKLIGLLLFSGKKINLVLPNANIHFNKKLSKCGETE